MSPHPGPLGPMPRGGILALTPLAHARACEGHEQYTIRQVDKGKASRERRRSHCPPRYRIKSLQLLVFIGSSAALPANAPPKRAIASAFQPPDLPTKFGGPPGGM